MSKIIDRILKILATANGTANEHEADAARRIADAMMAAADLRPEDIGDGFEDPVASVRDERSNLRARTSWEGIASVAAARMTGATVYIDSADDAILHWVGSDDQRAAAQVFFEYMLAQCARAEAGAKRAAAAQSRISARRYLFSFRVGFMGAIAAAVRRVAAARPARADEPGLVLANRLDAAIRAALPKLGKRRTAAVDTHAYQAGHTMGAAVAVQSHVAGASVCRLGAGS